MSIQILFLPKWNIVEISLSRSVRIIFVENRFFYLSLIFISDMFLFFNWNNFKLYSWGISVGDIYFDTFGDFRVFKAGQAIELPRSKKSRALLAFLFVTNRPQRRERLCEYFFENTNDPKRSLRWSLCVLKKVFPQTHCKLIHADYERISLDHEQIDSDYDRLKAIVEGDMLPALVFKQAKITMRREFLAGVDLENLEQYSVWLKSARERILDLKEQLYSKAIDTSGLTFVQREAAAREWLEFRPFSQDAAIALVKAIQDQGQEDTALSVEAELILRFRDAGLAYKKQPKSQSKLTTDRVLEVSTHKKISFA